MNRIFLTFNVSTMMEKVATKEEEEPHNFLKRFLKNLVMLKQAWVLKG